jgi:hypothetical protein
MKKQKEKDMKIKIIHMKDSQNFLMNVIKTEKLTRLKKGLIKKL